MFGTGAKDKSRSCAWSGGPRRRGGRCSRRMSSESPSRSGCEISPWCRRPLTGLGNISVSVVLPPRAVNHYPGGSPGASAGDAFPWLWVSVGGVVGAVILAAGIGPPLPKREPGGTGPMSSRHE
jgi:hypothetical protein